MKSIFSILFRPAGTRASPSRSILRYLIHWEGIIFILGGVMLIRLPRFFAPWLQDNPVFSHLTVNPADSFFFRRLPLSLTPGFILILVGIYLQWIARHSWRNKKTEREGKKPCDSENRDEKSNFFQSSFCLRESLPVFILAVGVMLLFFGLEWIEFYSIGLVLAWIFLLLGVSIGLAFRDRQNQVRLHSGIGKREWIFLSLAAGFLLTFYAMGFNSWKFAFIGDEYAFFWKAERILEKGIWNLNWFEATGVYREHPQALSGWQALWMKLLGPANFAWRFSSAILSVACLFPLYLTIRYLATGRTASPELVAVVGCACFFLSEPILIWSRVGQQNISGLIALIFSPCLLLAARRRQSRFYFFLAGAVCGIGLLLNSLGSLIAAVLLAGLLLSDPAYRIIREGKRSISEVSPLLFVLAGFLIAGAPNLVQMDYFQHLVDKHFLMQGEPLSLSHRIRMTLETALIPFYSQANDHFLWGNLVDPVNAFLVAMALGAFHRMGMRTAFLLIFFGLATALLTGGISEYAYLPVTRIHLMMYPVSMISAIGFMSLTRNRKGWNGILALVVVVGMGMWNGIKHHDYNPYQTSASHITHFLKRIQESDPGVKQVFLFPAKEKPYFCRTMATSFGYSNRVFILKEEPEDLEKLNRILSESGENVSLTFKLPIERPFELMQLATEQGATLQPPLPDRAYPERLQVDSSNPLVWVRERILDLITWVENH